MGVARLCAGGGDFAVFCNRVCIISYNATTPFRGEGDSCACGCVYGKSECAVYKNPLGVVGFIADFYTAIACCACRSGGFQRYHGLSLEQAQIGVAKYRERFRDTGIFENEVIAGIPEVLEELKKRGYVMALATSKPEEFALRITKHFHLAQYFEIEVGSGMNGELKYKADVIAEVLRRIAQKHPEQDMAEIEADSVMIGDRVHDIEGAKKCKIESVGVRFGFAKPGELEEAGADEIVATPEELLEVFG